MASAVAGPKRGGCNRCFPRSLSRRLRVHATSGSPHSPSAQGSSFPKRRKPRIDFMADSLAGLGTVSARRSRDVCAGDEPERNGALTFFGMSSVSSVPVTIGATPKNHVCPESRVWGGDFVSGKPRQPYLLKAGLPTVTQPTNLTTRGELAPMAATENVRQLPQSHTCD